MTATATPAVLTARIYAGYLALQALCGLLLWVALDSSATVRSWFELVGENPAVTDGFFLADMVVVAASALAAWAMWTDRSWAFAAVGFVAGGVVYPTAYLLWWVGASDGDGEVALGVMVMVSACTCWVLVDSCLSRRRNPASAP